MRISCGTTFKFAYDIHKGDEKIKFYITISTAVLPDQIKRHTFAIEKTRCQQQRQETMSISIDDLKFLTLNVGHAIHDADWNWTDVSSPFARIYLVTEGTAIVNIAGNKYELQPHHLYLIPPFVKHDDICHGHFEHYYIHIYEDPRSPLRILEDWKFPFCLQAGELERQLCHRLCQLNPQMHLTQSAPSSYDNSRGLFESLRRNKMRMLFEQVESRGIIYQLIARFLAEAKPKTKNCDSRIQKAIQYMRQNIHRQVDFEQLVELSCMSKDHFIRTFRREMGITPMRYIIERKMEHAQLLLTTGDMPVKAIAYAIGYFDHSYFNRLFKKEVGMTPQQYRDRGKK